METVRVVGTALIIARWPRFVRWAVGFTFLAFAGLGAGIALVVPYLARTSIWSAAQAEAMAEGMMDAAARQAKNVGGETR